MSAITRKHNNNYDRVMSRVYNRSSSNLKSSSNVTRHEIPSSVRIGAKPSTSNVGSSVISELPIVLNDYVPDSSCEKVAKRSFVVKPRRTVKSLDPALSPPRPVLKAREYSEKLRLSNIRVRGSAPSVLHRNSGEWSDVHVRQCHSSRSHTKLKELKDEIKVFHETEKLIKLRKHLYKKCGVVLDDVGQVAKDKAVQAEVAEPVVTPNDKRSEQWSNGEDAGAPVPDQQMRSEKPRYPVDRYLVESSKQSEMVNIIDDEIWNTEPMLRPEDEIILKKLHEMLQSTADDLKLLSGELSKFHEPGVQVKTLPTPLDEEFNEKVHIEEIVNAKFHGYKMIDKMSSPSPSLKPQKELADGFRSVASKLRDDPPSRKPKVSTTGVQVNVLPKNKKPTASRNLGMSRTRVIQINETISQDGIKDKMNETKIINSTPAVAYNEFSYKYMEPQTKLTVQKALQIQEMPSVNIRSELKEQKVLHLDIIPENEDAKETAESKPNTAVIQMQYEAPLQPMIPVPPHTEQSPQPVRVTHKRPIRKVYKMSTCDSSGSTNNVSSDTKYKIKTQNQIRTVKISPRSSTRGDRDRNKKISQRKESDKRAHFNLDEWKRKLNMVYGQPSTSKNVKPSKVVKKVAPKKSKSPSQSTTKLQKNYLNNAEYIPYSKLTLGGVNVSDIEREISNLPNKNDAPLSPILDKILSSRDSSCNNSPKKHKQKDYTNIFTTSDENLLQEVIDIEKTVSKTLSKNIKKGTAENPKNASSKNNVSTSDNDSYADDFEEDKSDNSEHSQKQSNDDKSEPKVSNISISDEENAESSDNVGRKESKIIHNTISKTSNLSLKNTVDIFEFVHSVDTQDTATQSNATHKISLKGTQTSPRDDKPTIQPIHNDLWPSIDPRGEVEKMFKLEKDFIKKLIIDEYGDLLESNITKPSTSRAANEIESMERNIIASQKNTQTSPAHVKHVMTSPTRTKTRMTSPFALSLTVDKQSSPIVLVTSEEDLKVKIEKETDDVGISINLSSPRFSLRLPQTSREVLSNLEVCSHRSNLEQTGEKADGKLNEPKEKKLPRKSTVSSSSSIDADYSSSEISSLGEVNWKLKRKIRKNRIPMISESSSSSSLTKYNSDLASDEILPLRSEGELSLGQTVKSRNRKPSKSDGEMSFGQI